MNTDVEASRERLVSAVRDTRSALDFPKRIQRSFRRQPATWIVGAVVVGAVVMMMPRRKVVYIHDSKKHPKSKVLEAGFLMGAARIAATLLRPMVLNFVRQRFSGPSARPGRSSWS